MGVSVVAQTPRVRGFGLLSQELPSRRHAFPKADVKTPGTEGLGSRGVWGPREGVFLLLLKARAPSPESMTSAEASGAWPGGWGSGLGSRCSATAYTTRRATSMAQSWIQQAKPGEWLLGKSLK